MMMFLVVLMLGFAGILLLADAKEEKNTLSLGFAIMFLMLALIVLVGTIILFL